MNKLYLGIDVGSVSANTVILNDRGEILEERYTRIKGQPLKTVQRVLEEVLSRIPPERFHSISLTGTGGKLLSELLEGHFVNEIIAQARASNIPPAVEEKVCKRLGLKPEAVATQVVQRDRHAEYLLTLALIAASFEKIAVEIRHLQRSEVLEAEEPFMAGQKGSSAMPHKRNPIGCENLTGLARLVRSNAMAALENIALWHERDISHSSVERVIIPDSSILTDYMLARLRGILDRLQVYPKKMKENMAKSYGLFNSHDSGLYHLCL